jgi:hypothetical protein
MPRARIFALLACLGATAFHPSSAKSAIDTLGPLAADHGPIRARRDVPDDPLAGLPTEDSGRPGRRKDDNRTARRCKLDARAANPLDIGDLRATLAFVQRGPRAWPCPPQAKDRSVGLRITVEDSGKITTVETTAGNVAVAASIAKKLTGKSIAPRPQGATTGNVVLTFLPPRGR